MNVYLETSAIVKLLRAEEGSDIARAAAATDNIRISSVITYVETCSAIARAGRARIRADVRRARRELDAFWIDVHQVELDDHLAHRAADLAMRHSLRGMDAVHLAAALQVTAAGDLSLASWDEELRNAGRREGLLLLPERI